MDCHDDFGWGYVDSLSGGIGFVGVGGGKIWGWGW